MTATSPKNKASLDKQKSTNKKSIHIYAATLGSLFLLTFFIHWYRTLLPTPLTDAQAIKVDGFAGQHAYDEYLSRFVKPHSANTRENGVMRDFFGSVALDIQKEALDHGLKMDVIANDPAVDILPHDWFSPSKCT
jgi:hypothetical protein